MRIINSRDIMETIEMLTAENLDVRTVTMGISLLDCIDPDADKACEKIYNKITRLAGNLVSVVDGISAEYGIPIVNKRISVTPIAMLLGAAPDADPVQYAKTLDRAAKAVGVNFIGGFGALVHKGFSAGDKRLITAIPRALAETDIVCSSVNIGSTKSGINMDAVKLMGEVVRETAELTKDNMCMGDAKLVVFCNAPEDNPFMAGAFHGAGEPDCEIHVGVSGPGAVRAALAKLPKDAPMDEVAELPYARDWHPDYDAAGGVPAFAEIKFSISSNRGCFGECSFCALTFHQGRVLQMRSHDSIMREAELLTRDPEFKGYINDVGGPTANFSRPACDKQLKHGVCKNKRCLWPSVCKNMVVDESGYTQLLRDLRQLPGVKKVFVRSGIRFDYTMADASDEFLRELLEHHVSGQLRVAPEHVSDAVLSVMGKPSRAVYDAFCRKFERLNREYGLKQYVVPYLISSHPGSTMKEAVDLAEAVRDMGYMPEQVQDFYPTPSTMSTCMYYTGVDPRTMEPIYVARDPHEKAMQRALIQYRKPENYKLVREALEKAGRRDLIGYTKHCLIRPVPPRPGETSANGGHGTGKKGGKPHGGAGKGPKGSKGHSGMSRAQNTAGRNRAAQGRQGANGGGRRN